MGENADEQKQNAQFLLEEYKQLDNERIRLRDEGIARLNFFLTLTSAVLGGIVLFGQSNASFKIEYILLIALIFLSVIGWYTFNFTVDRDINTDRLLRAAGRIRRYFTKKSPDIKAHIMWQDHDEPSKYVTRNNSIVRKIMHAALSLLLALTIGLLLNLATQNAMISILAGVVSFVIFLSGFEFYARRHFRKAAKEAETQILQPKQQAAKTKAGK